MTTPTGPTLPSWLVNLLLGIETFVVAVLGAAAIALLQNNPVSFDPTSAAGQHQIIVAIAIAILQRLAAATQITGKAVAKATGKTIQ